MCGSFCTFSSVIPHIKELKDKWYSILPIMSETSFTTDTRFGTAESFVTEIEDICGKKIIHSIKGAEPIGPKKLLDIMVIAPCTGNTLAKLACGIADSSVTLAAKAHLRNERPIVIAVSSNDSLANNAKNIGTLLNMKNYYFVPMKQDAPLSKPRSVVADFTKISDTVSLAFEGKQIQPIWL
ncbi:MAG: dipicolinate synthase subunit B [Clostridia bacterium]|nr:dipicolinate synthase subunit B [Clostridia bacterium]